MKKIFFAVAVVTTASWAVSTFAAENNPYPNGSQAIPDSSTAATPSSVKQSPGTVGAMKNAEEGSFTASKKAQKQEHGN